MTEEKRLSLGINVSILLILTIFGVLLSLPLRLLFDTNYSDHNRGDGLDDPEERGREAAIPMDHRKLKRCPNLQYEDRLMSVFMSDYDENCTYVQDDDEYDDDEDDDDDDSDSEEDEDSREDEDEEEEKTYGGPKRSIGEEMKESAEEILKTRQMKSVTVAGHILVTMLLVSVIAALVEVLRIRFAREKDSSRAGTIISRRCSSSVDIPATRRPISRELIRSQKSFEIPGMHRSALRLLGARPPPLIRRFSFPTPQAKQAAISSLCGTPSKGLTRRQSAESDEEIGMVTNALHHRTRLIRRH
ncbi:nucleoplasmin-like protein ANO39 isoform X1 [Pogonomyrmex barbatus]|uniref:Nucleoplasmin-like protein ANO39 isoform X1 n=1 Tax=Pogonomyrmex barbatus TaxID=144034 RepID=A0A6I9X4L8_9HYME|nr:nucleoplasmin-like protein ANO39 isoform X1 [Pogonomyrmex barbatus]